MADIQIPHAWPTSATTMPDAARAPAPAYNWLARLLHWISAGIILWALVTGLVAASLPTGAPLKGWIGFVNVSLTTVLIPLFLLRIANRLASPEPAPLSPSPAEARAARAAHAGLYLVTMVVLVSGVAMVAHPASIFGLFTLPVVPLSADTRHVSELIHRYACYLLAVMIVLHLAAVTYHHLKGRSPMRRMRGC